MLMKLIGLGLLILFVQGCIKSEYYEVMYVEVILPGMDERYSAEDIRFLDIMSGRMFQREDKHYESPLPLKYEVPFPFSESIVQRCLMSLMSKFQKDPKYHQRYSAVMQEMLDSNFAEIVPPDEASPINRIWYIPHHGVLRVVFDCSSEFRGVSLNNRLLQGSNLMSKVPI